MASHGDDLSLLLSLRDRIPESPPSSPSRLFFPALSPKCPRHGISDMSVFKDAVKDYLAEDHVDNTPVTGATLRKETVVSNVEVEKFSGLRLRKCFLSQSEINSHFSDVRFVRLPALRSSLMGDTVSGCWATAGVLTEKGSPRQSSNGKTFCIWKLGVLDESTVSVFLFGDAHTNNMNERVGTVFALLNSLVRKDNMGNGFSLSISSSRQMVKIGVSADYGICKGKRKDGLACTMAINKRQGSYCKYHASGTAQRYSTGRAELRGGNLRTAFRPRSEGIYMFDPLKGKSNSMKHGQPLKVMSVDGLKKALSGANRVTTRKQSQGIRFLSEVTAQPNKASRASVDSNNVKTHATKRSLPTTKVPSVARDELDSKKKKCGITNMIELDISSSDEEK